jgi:hypothetical protein
MVKVPGTSKVVGPVCTIFESLNIIYGSCWRVEEVFAL